MPVPGDGCRTSIQTVEYYTAVKKKNEALEVLTWKILEMYAE